MKKFNFVYKVTNLINHKEYIGVHSTNKLEDGYLGSGTRITNAVKKYDPHNFKREIIYMAESLDEAFEEEARLVDLEYIQRPDTYNIRPGGRSSKGNLGYRLSEEQKQRLREIRPFDGPNNPNYGKGYRQAGKRNGRHRDNFKGDIKVVGRRISSALKQTTLNKKGNNSASREYHLKKPDGRIINISKGYLDQFCNENNLVYLVLYNTIKTGKPITRTKYTNHIGMQLFEGLNERADEIYG